MGPFGPGIASPIIHSLGFWECRLWSALTQAIIAKDMEAATAAKSAVEDAQREKRRVMEEKGKKHIPRFFELKGGRWVPKVV